MRKRNRQSRYTTESLEVRILLAAAPVRLGDVLYFPGETQPVIERFDLTSGEWLAAISLQGTPGGTSVFHVDAEGIYTASGSSVFRYNLDGSGLTTIATVANPVENIHTDGNLLIINHCEPFVSGLTSVNKLSGTVLHANWRSGWPVHGSSISSSANRVVGRTVDGRIGDTLYVDYDDNGRFIAGVTTAYYSVYPLAIRTWTTSDGGRTVDNAGNVYSTHDLRYSSTLGGPVTDVEFRTTGGPITLSGTTLTVFSSAWLPTASVTLDHTPSEIADGTSGIYTFATAIGETHGHVARFTPYSDFQPAAPGPPINPSGLVYAPEQAEITNDGTLLLLDTQSSSIFRWNPDTQTYGETISLIGPATRMAYAPLTNAVYLAYASGLVSRIDLDDASPQELPFAILQRNPVAIEAAGEFLFGVDDFGSGYTHYTFGPDGAMIGFSESNYFSTEYIWNSNNRRVYFFRDAARINDLHSEAISASGVFGSYAESPLHSNAGFQHPIRVSRDGAFVVLGSGVVHDGVTLERLSKGLSNGFQDAVWLNDSLVTVRRIEGVFQLQAWDYDTFQLRKSFHLPAEPIVMLSLPGERVFCLIRGEGGVPFGLVLNSELQPGNLPIGVTVLETDSVTTVSERGTSDSFTVVLNSAPISDVVFSVSTDAPDEIAVQTTQLTFTPANWNVPQTTAVVGINDGLQDGDQTALIRLTVHAAMSDAAFAVMQDQFVVATNLDDDAVFNGFLPANRLNDTVWLVSRSTSEIARFDVANGTWLDSIVPTGGLNHPSASLVDEDGIFIAFGKDVYRYSKDGRSRTKLLHTEYEVIGLHSDGHLLFVNFSSLSNFNTSTYVRMISIDKRTNSIVDTFENFNDALGGCSIAPGLNRMFGRSFGIDPTDITYVDYDDAGHFTVGGNSEYHSELPDATKTWTVPHGGYVIDDSGTVYTTEALRFVAALGGGIQDVDFHGNDVPVVLSGRYLRAYSQGFSRTGFVELDHSPSEIVVGSDQVFTFTPDDTNPHGITARSIPLADLNPATPGAPLNPIGLAYVPDNVALAINGTVLLFDSELRSIFRWNPRTNSYDDTIPLSGSPDYFAYSPNANTVYLAYGSGVIRKLRLSEAHPVEEPFAILSKPPTGLSTAGEFVFVTFVTSDYIPERKHSTFTPYGTLIDTVSSYYHSVEYVWNAANRMMYFLRDTWSPNDLHAESISQDGQIGTPIETPLHGGGFAHPIRVSPDGRVVALRYGSLFDGRSLEPLGDIPGEYEDFAWLDSGLVMFSTESELTLWSLNASGLPETQQSRYDLWTLDRFMKPIALIPLADGTLVAVSSDYFGVPIFTLFDGDLAPISADLRLKPFPRNITFESTPLFEWTAIPGARRYDIEIQDSSERVTYRSTQLTPHYEIPVALRNGDYRIRVRVELSSGVRSLWSDRYAFNVDAITVLLPFLESTVRQPTITWTSQSGAAQYEVWINDLDTRTLVHRMTGLTGTSHELPEPLQPGRYGVWVRSHDSAGKARPWSERRAFDVLTEPILPAVGVGGYTDDSTPRLEWARVPRAVSYDIVVRSLDGRLAWRRTGVTATAADVTTALTPGHYTVWVRAFAFGRSISVWGQGLTVTSAPLLTGSGRTIQWSEVSGAVSYDLKVIRLHTSSVALMLTGTTATSATLGTDAPFGQYSVSVRSNYSALQVSHWRTITIELFRDAVAVTSDASPTADQTPVITWTAATGAASYDLVVYRSDTDLLEYSRSGLQSAGHRINQPLTNGSHRVWVRARFADGSRSHWSSPYALVIGSAPRLSLQSGVLSWSSLRDATHYDLWVNYTDIQNQSHARYIRLPLYTATSYRFPALPPGRYSAWVRILRMETGSISEGSWSTELSFAIGPV